MPVHHVIVGGGPVATNALETIREFDDGASQITLVSDEPAHSRMALPYWLAGQVPREHTMTADDDYYRKLNVDARIGCRVDRVDPQGKAVSLSDGSSLRFDNLLIATGSSPIRLNIPGIDLPGVQPLWTLQQTQELLAACNEMARPEVVMLGAGFIGFIMLNAMYKRGWKLTVVERESHVLPRMLDAASAELVQSWLTDRGVSLYCGTSATGISQSRDNSKKVVELANGQRVQADVVVAAVGIRPNTALVENTSIDSSDGILVNDRMQTNFPYIYAGGDVARGPVLYSDRPAIHAIQPTAVDHGRIAGANMAGHEVLYPGSLLMNILDACGLQAASFGNWSDQNAEAMTISNSSRFVYRKLLWTGDELTGAIFLGPASDVGMLTDVGMVKGILQTRTRLGPWKQFLRENPFDIRRPYVAAGVAQKLSTTTLLGRPSKGRRYRFSKTPVATTVPASHKVYVAGKKG